MAELESRIASYEEAAIQANRNSQAKEEKLHKENQTLRVLLNLSGTDPMAVEQHVIEGYREGISEEMNLRCLDATNSGSFGTEMHGDLTAFQLSNVSLPCACLCCKRE